MRHFHSLASNLRLRLSVALMAAAVAGLTALATPTLANEDSLKVRKACASDAKRLCPNAKHGSPDMRYCMEAKQSYLSRSCGRALEDEGIAPRGYFTAKK